MNRTNDSILVGSIQKFSVEDGPGIRTTVFFKGCPLNCKWCHNPELINPKQQLIKSPRNCIGCGYCIKTCPQSALSVGESGEITVDYSKCNACMECASQCYARALRPVAKEMTVEEIMSEVEQDKGFYNHTDGGITLSGGEILLHGEMIEKIVDAAALRKIDVCLDTSGYGSQEVLINLARKENVTDILYDVKSVDDDVHREYTGVSNEVILENLRALAGDETLRAKITARMPLISGVNDSEEIIRKTGELYREIGIEKVNLLPYHNLGIGKQRNIGGVQEEFQQPSEERIDEIVNYFGNEINLKVEVLGRV